jgi:hypothetical protein
MHPLELPAQVRTGQPTDLTAGWDRTEFGAYPDLKPLQSLAVDAAIYTFGIDAEAESDLIVHLEEVVAAALVAAYVPIAVIARQATRVADQARTEQLAATARTAQELATQVAEVAAALRARDDALAVEVAQAASDAADLVAATVAPGGEGAAASAAAQIAAAVRDAAAAKSEEHAQEAAIVAQAAAAAAATITDTADSQNIAVELKVFEAAAAVQAIARDACYQVAVNAAATAAGNAFMKRMPTRENDKPAEGCEVAVANLL